MSWKDDTVCADAALRNTYPTGKSIGNLYTRGDNDPDYEEPYRRLHWPYECCYTDLHKEK